MTEIPGIRFVRVGTLLEPDRLPPDIHIFTSSKQPWVVLPPDTPAVPEYYDLKHCCRDEPFARGFNPRLRLERAQTIMEGSDHCDFRYYLEEVEGKATGGENR